MKLITETTAGTVGQVCSMWNTHALADHVISMQYNGAGHVVTVFKVPDEQVAMVWRKLGRTPETCPVQPKSEQRF